jgi:hypothetical protein
LQKELIMAKETRKPSFDAPSDTKEGTGWVYKSKSDASESAAAPAAGSDVRSRIGRGVTTTMDVVTYPLSLALVVVLLPGMRLADWWRR